MDALSSGDAAMRLEWNCILGGEVYVGEKVNLVCMKMNLDF